MWQCSAKPVAASCSCRHTITPFTASAALPCSTQHHNTRGKEPHALERGPMSLVGSASAVRRRLGSGQCLNRCGKAGLQGTLPGTDAVLLGQDVTMTLPSTWRPNMGTHADAYGPRTWQTVLTACRSACAWGPLPAVSLMWCRCRLRPARVVTQPVRLQPSTTACMEQQAKGCQGLYGWLKHSAYTGPAIFGI